MKNHLKMNRMLHFSFSVRRIDESAVAFILAKGNEKEPDAKTDANATLRCV